MDSETEQKIIERLAELPESVRSAIQSIDLQKKIQSLGAQHSLHIDQIGELESEVLMLMLGFSDPAIFEKRLAKTLSLTPEASSKIVAEINADILLPIREDMRVFAEKKALLIPEPHPADLMLSQKTVSVAPAAPAAPNAAPVAAKEVKVEAPKPQPYKTDPYREPTN